MIKKQRSAIFDIAKCLAIILVVLGHLVNECVDAPAYGINIFHMPTLFCISGYFATFSLQKRNCRDILIKKSKTLLIPYMFWSVVSLAANTLLSVVTGTVTMQSVTEEFTAIFLYARSVWFLVELFITFLIFLSVYRLARILKMERYELCGHCAAWLILAVFAPDELLAFYKFKWLYPFFIMGYCVGMYNEEIASWMKTGKKYCVFGLASLLFPLMVFTFLHNEYFWDYTRFEYKDIVSVAHGVLYYVISTLGIVLLFTLSHWLSKTGLGNVCAEIGTYSMDVYVIHMFLVKLICFAMPVDSQSLLTAYCLFGLISVALVFLIFIFSKNFLRKISLYRNVVGAGD